MKDYPNLSVSYIDAHRQLLTRSLGFRLLFMSWNAIWWLIVKLFLCAEKREPYGTSGCCGAVRRNLSPQYRCYLEPHRHFCHLYSSVSCVNAIQKKQLQPHTFASSCFSVNLPSICCAPQLTKSAEKFRSASTERCGKFLPERTLPWHTKNFSAKVMNWWMDLLINWEKFSAAYHWFPQVSTL